MSKAMYKCSRVQATVDQAEAMEKSATRFQAHAAKAHRAFYIFLKC